jgi:hypothetical protein
MLVLAVATPGFDAIPSVGFDKLDDCPDFHRSIPEFVREATRTLSGLALEVSAVEDFDGIHAYDRTKSTNIRGSIATTGPIPLRKAMSLCSKLAGN